jgi:hypothetical protein
MVWIRMGRTCREGGVNAYDEKWGCYGRRRTWGDTDPL